MLPHLKVVLRHQHRLKGSLRTPKQQRKKNTQKEKPQGSQETPISKQKTKSLRKNTDKNST